MREHLQSAFDGVYRIGDMIGGGQCSTTFLGTSVASTERVALKVLQLGPTVDPGLADRVARQVRASQEVASECHLVPSRFDQRGSLAAVGNAVHVRRKRREPPSQQYAAIDLPNQ